MTNKSSNEILTTAAIAARLTETFVNRFLTTTKHNKKSVFIKENEIGVISNQLTSYLPQFASPSRCTDASVIGLFQMQNAMRFFN